MDVISSFTTKCDICNCDVDDGHLLCHYICRHPELWITIYATTVNPLTVINEEIYNISVYELDSSQENDINIEDISIENDKTSLSIDDPCPICLEYLIDQERVCKMNVCNHNYCKPCIERWVEENDDCPMCKRTLF